MTEHRTSVVIRSYNEEQHIGRLLIGLLQQTRRPDQIVLVDSGSTDATLAIASRFPVEIHEIDPETFSFGHSLNVGCGAATGDLIAIVSAHVYPVYDTWLDELVAPFGDPEVALVYGRQEGDERTKYSERQIMARWFPSMSERRQEHPFCNNANAAIRRSVWASAPYDEELTGLEDIDWAKRALEAGHGVSYVATAPVVHAHDETWRQLVNRYRREAIAHMIRGRYDAGRLEPRRYFDDYTHRTAYTDAGFQDFLRSLGWSIEHAEPRFTPFTMKSRLPTAEWLISLYLALPYRPLAGQFLIVAGR